MRIARIGPDLRLPLLGEQNIQAKEVYSLSGLDDRLKKALYDLSYVNCQKLPLHLSTMTHYKIIVQFD